MGAAVPTPDRTSLEEIIQAGRDILESDGLARLTMQAVADRVGVRAPSLYKRVASRDDLIGYIAEATVHDLTERLTAAVAGADARADLAGLARRSEEHTSELQSRENLVCRLLLEKKKKRRKTSYTYKTNRKTKTSV